MTLVKNRTVPKLCYLAFWATSYQAVASEAFVCGNKVSTDGSTLAQKTCRNPSSIVALKSNLERFEADGIQPIVGVRGGGAPSESKQLFRELSAEFIGTFLIVQLGTGAVMSAVFTDALLGLFQIASVWIIAVTIAICTTASISGAHLNPAVSVAFALLRPSTSFNWKKVVPYSIAQLLGAVCASWINLILYSSSIAAFESANGIVRSSSSGIASAKAFGEYFLAPISTNVAFLAEFLGTGILSFVIFALTNPKNDTMKDGFVPPIIGATVGGLIAILAPLTQAGFNPARDFGPRIVAFLAGWKTVAFQGWWVYVLGPLLGAPIGAAVADTLLYSD